MKCYLAIKKNKEILQFVTTWMDLEGIMLRLNQTEKDKYWIISLICEIFLKTEPKRGQGRVQQPWRVQTGTDYVKQYGDSSKN